MLQGLLGNKNYIMAEVTISYPEQHTLGLFGLVQDILQIFDAADGLFIHFFNKQS